jgi:hypothetical protein
MSLFSKDLDLDVGPHEMLCCSPGTVGTSQLEAGTICPRTSPEVPEGVEALAAAAQGHHVVGLDFAQ